MKFSDFVCFEAITAELKAKDRDSAIEELASALGKAGKLGNVKPASVIKAVIKRENEASTGMGKGVAVPHVKHSAVKEAVAAIGRSEAGLDFSSLDKQPVYSVILLISPDDNPEKHLQAMETIFSNLQHDKFRKWLRQCETNDQIKDLLNDVDENPSILQS